MIVLAIDPGKRSGFVEWDGGTILAYGNVPNKVLLQVIEESTAHACVIERLSRVALRNQDTDYAVFWAGQFTRQWDIHHSLLGITATTLERAAVVKHLYGGRSSDSLVRKALMGRFCEDVTKGLTKHAWQAFGLAVTWWDLQAKKP